MVSPRVLVLAAFETDPGTLDELQPWLDGHALDERVDVAGVDGGVRVTPDGLGLVKTGMGPVEAATTVSTLLSAPSVDAEDTYFLTVGVGGGPPTEVTTGSVVLADRVVDWDRKYRYRSGEDPAMVPISHARGGPERAFVYETDPDLVAAARSVASEVDLADDEDAHRHRERYPHPAAGREPFVTTGTAVAGGEYWHGDPFATQAADLVDGYDAGTYRVTNSEDSGTAGALDRHGALDRYLSVRAVSNFDRAHPDQNPGESLAGHNDAHDLAIENAYRVGSAIAEVIVEDWEAWRDGPPTAGGRNEDAA